MSVTPGIVEQVHPAEGKTQHQEAQVRMLPTQITHDSAQEENTLHKTVNGRETTEILQRFVIKVLQYMLISVDVLKLCKKF